MNGRKYKFENDVNQYGTQTLLMKDIRLVLFENDVNQYGTQTNKEVFQMKKSV